jgi:polysaccharide biosynthesis protein PslJ
MSTASATADPRRRSSGGAGAYVAAGVLAALLLTVVATASPRAAAATMGLGLVAIALAVAHRQLLQWRVLVAGIVLVILLVPIRRYSLPGALPIDLEPYRLVVLVVLIAWIGSALVQPGVVMRRTGLEGPIVAFSIAVLASVAFNLPRIDALGVESEVIKTTTFFASVILVAYLCASVLSDPHARRSVVSVLVAGAAVVAALAIVESRTGYNIFNHLGRAIPILDFDAAGIPAGTDARGGRVRAYASAQHSIALGAALAMVLPLGLYLARRTGHYRWWMASGLLVVGVLVTVSRTAFVMLVVEAIVLFVLKPGETRRLLPFVLPCLVAVQFAMPGTLTALKTSFFPEGGLIAEQQAGAGTYGSGRVADLGPGLEEWSARPIAGQGLGSRITNRADPRVNAPILDDQWLGLLLEVGAFGVAAFIWLLVRATRRLGRIARHDDSDDGWLAAALAASIAGYGIGMVTFDAFSFIQVTFLVFILLGLAAPELRTAMQRYPLVSQPPSSRLTAASRAA